MPKSETLPTSVVDNECPSVIPLSDTRSWSDQDYIDADPFAGDESELACRSVKIRRARKSHLCYGLDGSSSHSIMPGQRYRYEKALVNGSYWGEYRLCVKCLNEWLNEWVAGGER